jgi:hypothetical protein
MAIEEKHTPNIWDGLAAIVWTLILLMGLFPETFFDILRKMGHVTIHQAVINTVWFVTFSCAGFMGWFTYQRSRECNDREDVAIGKGVQVTVLALAAFLPLQIEQFPAYLHITIPSIRNLILAIIAAKLATWIFLVQLILRYYLFSGLDIFRKMPLLFPSALKKTGNNIPSAIISTPTDAVEPSETAE